MTNSTRQRNLPRMLEDSGSRTRDRVLFLLKTRGAQTAAELAGRLGVTAMAVRQHLASLESEALVEFEDERRSVGRPARVWRLSSAASARFPDSHADLTVDLLAVIREAYGEQGLDRLIDLRSKRQLASYREALGSGPLEQKLDTLARLRTAEGYMAEWQRDADGCLFVENHCPICAAASACQRLCRDELEVFREALGPGVEVERIEHVLAGARRCAYRIRVAA